MTSKVDKGCGWLQVVYFLGANGLSGLCSCRHVLIWFHTRLFYNQARVFCRFLINGFLTHPHFTKNKRLLQGIAACHFLRAFWAASWAACCLLGPCPWLYDSLLTYTCTVNCLAWSGPSALTVL